MLLVVGLACKNPVAKYMKQYNCSVAGEPEPQSSDEFISRGYKHIELNNYSNRSDQCAFGAAAEAVRLDPKNPDAYVLRGNLYREREEYDSALDDLNEAIRLAPDKPIYYLFRSLVFEKKNKLAEAIEDMSVALKNEPSDRSYARRGSLYYKQEDYENALKDYTEAIRLKPAHESHYTLRAEVYRKTGKTAEAEADELKAKDLENSSGKPDSAYSKENSSPPITNPQIKNSDLPKTISGGVLNGKATNLVKPPYPPAARAVRASGAVNVQVTVDETGDVIAASAVSGHPLLRAAAVQAARSSKFSPTMLSGKAVKVTGVIVYNFTPE